MDILEKMTGNVSENTACWNAVETAIESHGVDVPEGTPKTEYADKVNAVFDAGKQAEYDKFWDAYQDNGARTHLAYAFYRWDDEIFYPKYDIIPTVASSLFAYCRIKNLKQRLLDCGVTLDMSNAGNISNALAYSSTITIIPEVNLSNRANTVVAVFRDNPNLHTIEKVILGDKPDATYDAWFANDTALENITFEGVMSNDIGFGHSPLLTKESIINIFNALSSTATEKKITFKRGAVRKAFATIEGAADGDTSQEWANLVATKPNWTVAFQA